ncbi:ankyrin repeat-containing domain protein [Hypomontagnella submonticulosa]|nr:ankyrin repeat-containing domain protein [Hypomontagnella submonticulosa]
MTEDDIQDWFYYKKRMRLLEWAVLNGHEVYTRQLLQRPQSKACLEEALRLASYDGDDTIVGMLLKHKVDVDARNNRHVTPLHAACICGHESIARRFLEHDADIQAIDEEDITPLHWYV